MQVEVAAAGGGKRTARRKRAAARQDRPAGGVARLPDASIAAADDPSEFATALREYVRNRQPHKAYEMYESVALAESPSVDEAYAALVRALLKLQRVDLALELHNRHTGQFPTSVDSNTTSVLFSRLLKRGTSNGEDGLAQAREMLGQLESRSSPPREGTAAEATPSGGGASLWASVSGSMLPALSLELLRRGEVSEAEATVQRVAEASRLATAAAPPLETLKTMMREMGKARSVAGAYACLDIMEHARIPPDSEMLQVMVDALVRQVRASPPLVCGCLWTRRMCLAPLGADAGGAKGAMSRRMTCTTTTAAPFARHQRVLTLSPPLSCFCSLFLLARVYAPCAL